MGIGTVIKDNPMLTCRLEGGHNPTRIVCDTNMRVPIDSNIVQTSKDIPTILVVGEHIKNAFRIDEELAKRYNNLIDRGIEILFTEESDGKINLKSLMKQLGERQIDSVILEGGATLNYSAIDANIVREIDIYMAPKILGGKDAPTAVGGKGFENPDLSKQFTLKEIRQYDGDVFLKYIANY